MKCTQLANQAIIEKQRKTVQANKKRSQKLVKLMELTSKENINKYWT